MRKIKEGRQYDTEAAMYVASCTHGIEGDPDWYTEKLYRKKTGEFFIAGEGGEKTRYAHRLYGTVGPGFDIIPLDHEDVRAWSADHEVPIPTELFDAGYGKGDRAGRYVGAMVSEEAVERLSLASRRTGESKAKILERLIMENL